jgi:CspA family cold shock protein
MSKTQNDTNVTPAGGASRQLGIVKWFNNKAGFGFVKTLGDESKDVFVHHSGVSVNREQYKYLVQGEYVEFNLSKSDNNDHEWQAIDVTGIQGGHLMCETRFLNKQERTERDPDEGGRVRQRGSGPRDRHQGGSRDRQHGSRDRPQGGSRDRGNNTKWELDETNQDEVSDQ